MNQDQMRVFELLVDPAVEVWVHIDLIKSLEQERYFQQDRVVIQNKLWGITPMPIGTWEDILKESRGSV